MKLKEDFNSEDQIENQIKDKIASIEDEIVTLKGKNGNFGWNKDDHSMFVKS